MEPGLVMDGRLERQRKPSVSLYHWQDWFSNFDSNSIAPRLIFDVRRLPIVSEHVVLHHGIIEFPEFTYGLVSSESRARARAAYIMSDSHYL